MIRWLKRVWASMNWEPTWPEPLPLDLPLRPQPISVINQIVNRPTPSYFIWSLMLLLLSLGSASPKAHADNQFCPGWKQSTAEVTIRDSGMEFVNFPTLTGVYFLQGFVQGAPVARVSIWSISYNGTHVAVESQPGDTVLVVFCRRGW